jgi:hypothetical protein
MPAGGVVSLSLTQAQAADPGKNARAAKPANPAIHEHGTRMFLISIDPPEKPRWIRSVPNPENPDNVSEKKIRGIRQLNCSRKDGYV